MDFAGERYQRNLQAFEGFEEADDFFGLAAVGDSYQRVAASQHAEIAVQRFGGMQEKGWRAGARECRRDFSGYQAGFAHTGDDHAAFAGEEKVNGFFEGGVETRQ